MEKPREIVVHQSANRPNMLLGADRELVLLSAMLSAALMFVIATWWGILLGVILWVVAVGILQRMGKADPLLRLGVRPPREIPTVLRGEELHSVPNVGDTACMEMNDEID